MATPSKSVPAARFEFHWLSITRILWKSRFGLLALWLVLGVIGFVIVRSLPAVYKADCLLLVVGQKIPDKYVTSTVSVEPQERLAALSHVILSNERLQDIIDTFGLYKNERTVYTKDELINRMRENDISLKLESGLSNSRPDAFRISYEARDPKLAADVANRLATSIIDENSRTRETHAEDTSQFIQSELRSAKDTLDQLEARLSQYKLSHNGELPEQESSLNGTLSRLQVKLQGNQEQMTRAEQSRMLLENTVKLAESSLTSLERAAQESKEQANLRSQAPAADPTALPVTRPKTHRETLQEELASLRERYGEDHPEIKRRKSELAALPPDVVIPNSGKPARVTGNPAVTAQDASLPPGLATAIVTEKERVANLRVQLTLSVKEFEAAKEDRARVLREIEGYQGRIDRLPVREQEMAALMRDYEIAKTNYKSLLDKKLSAAMATDMERTQQGEKFTLIDKARVPEQPSKPNRSILYPVSVVLSLLISVLVILVRRMPKDTMLGEWELTPGVVILGRVPPISRPSGIQARGRNLTSLAPGEANS